MRAHLEPFKALLAMNFPVRLTSLLKVPRWQHLQQQTRILSTMLLVGDITYVMIKLYSASYSAHWAADCAVDLHTVQMGNKCTTRVQPPTAREPSVANTCKDQH
jgi:hypothetical protein